MKGIEVKHCPILLIIITKVYGMHDKIFTLSYYIDGKYYGRI